MEMLAQLCVGVFLNVYVMMNIDGMVTYHKHIKYKNTAD